MHSEAIKSLNVKRINKLNYILCFIQLLIHAYFFFLAPLFLKTSLKLHLLNAVVFAVISSNQLWSLVHEGIHGLLSSHKKVNSFMLSLLSACFGSSATLLKAVHLFHHRYSRSELELIESYSAHENKQQIAKIYFFNLFGGLYVSELLYPLMSFFPRELLFHCRDHVFKNNQQVSKLIDHFLERPQMITSMRMELLLVYFVYGTAFFMYGNLWYVVVVFLLFRGLLISFLDYIYHYGTPLGDNLHGKNLKLPKVVSMFLLHFNYHGIHHLHPRVSWSELPDKFRERKEKYDSHYVNAAFEQLKGPILKDHLPKK